MVMTNIKQVIVVRTDLNMDAGKYGSQLTHATRLALLGDWRPVHNEPVKPSIAVTIEGWAAYWLQDEFKTIILAVDSLAELEALCEKAQASGIACGKVVDNGHTFFKNQKTVTCAAFGPAPADVIDPITGHLKRFTGLKAK